MVSKLQLKPKEFSSNCGSNFKPCSKSTRSFGPSATALVFPPRKQRQNWGWWGRQGRGRGEKVKGRNLKKNILRWSKHSLEWPASEVMGSASRFFSDQFAAILSSSVYIRSSPSLTAGSNTDHPQLEILISQSYILTVIAALPKTGRTSRWAVQAEFLTRNNPVEIKLQWS